ncbi:ABC transporter permease [Arcanobacterium hippocoleae]
MVRYLAKKAISWFVTIFLATNITYFLANYFLDPTSTYVGRRPPLPREQILSTLQPLNLNPEENIFVRWWRWITGIVTNWDWGYAPLGTPVGEEISYRIWVSAQLLLGATIIAVLIGIALGVFTAGRQYSGWDRVVQGIAIFALNLHIVVAGMLVVLLALWINNAAGVRLLYVTGAASLDVEGFWPRMVDILQHLTLPTIALVATSFAGYYFMQRSLLLDNIEADYVRTARAKGLTRSQAIRRHALRTSVIPVATSVAFSIQASSPVQC